MRGAIRSLLLTAGVVLPLGVAVVWTAYPTRGAGFAGGTSDAAEPREVSIDVYAWGFSPRVIHVSPGQRVRFVVRSEDIGHGFAINELGVNLPLRPGQQMRSPEVKVDLPEGVYEIHCSVFCGLGHPAMKGRLVVGAPPPTLTSAAPWVASLAVGLAAAGVLAVTALRSRRR
ncbi:MAG TPA: cupredoxin domain-containing protein [Methylomirabilota bacterium]|nr:cupredoxin domain-containing protein [Methylomirabilota bacterium]